MVSSDMEQRTVESGTALTFEPKMTRARTKQAFNSGSAELFFRKVFRVLFVLVC